MQHLENVSFTREFTSKYMKPMRLKFQKDGQNREFDMVAKHGSVATLLYHKEFNKFLVVRQFRPAVFVGRVIKYSENVGKNIEEIEWDKYDAEIGYTIELCAGLVDKKIPVVDIAREEIEEECGYFLPDDKIHFLATYTVDAEESDSQQFLFYAELEEKYKKTEGGGNIAEGEQITKVFLEVEEARQYMQGEESHGPPGACFAFEWWFQTKPEDRFNKFSEPVYTWEPQINSKMTSFHIENYMKSTRLQPIRMFYTLAPITRSWDLSPTTDTVVVFVYNTDTKEIILTQRFRPAKFVLNTIRINNGDPSAVNWDDVEQTRAYTLEMCGTRIQSSSEAEEKVNECIRQKLGYIAKSVKFITSFITGISQSGDRQRVYYAEIDEMCKLPFIPIPEIIPVSFSHEKLSCLLRQPRPYCPPAVLYMIYRFMNRSL